MEAQEVTQAAFQGVSAFKNAAPKDSPIRLEVRITPDTFGNGVFVSRSKDLSASNMIQVEFTYVKNRFFTLTSNPVYAAMRAAQYLDYKRQKRALISRYGRDDVRVRQHLAQKQAHVKTRLEIPLVLNLELTQFTRKVADHWATYIQHEEKRAEYAARAGELYTPLPYPDDKTLSTYTQMGAVAFNLGGGQLVNANHEAVRIEATAQAGNHSADRKSREIRIRLHIFSDGNALYPDSFEENLDLTVIVSIESTWRWAPLSDGSDPKKKEMEDLARKRIKELAPEEERKSADASVDGIGFSLPDTADEFRADPNPHFAMVFDALMKSRDEEATMMLTMIDNLMPSDTYAKDQFIRDYLLTVKDIRIPMNTPIGQLGTVLRAALPASNIVAPPAITELLDAILVPGTGSTPDWGPARRAYKNIAWPLETKKKTARLAYLRIQLKPLLEARRNGKPFEWENEGIISGPLAETREELFQYIFDEHQEWRRKRDMVNQAMQQKGKDKGKSESEKVEAKVDYSDPQAVVSHIQHLYASGAQGQAGLAVAEYAALRATPTHVQALWSLIVAAGLDSHPDAIKYFKFRVERGDGDDSAGLKQHMLDFIGEPRQIL
ncbi:hypothetical protein [Streptomyces sp. NPDC126514]|uniref:hypothetical protein n=1 Tax=Streptomyces sp. NPDC126514 TaxID=3155210 RepID=UPI00332767EC